MLSDELQERYRTECDIDWRAAFVLSHPSAGELYLIDHTEPFQGLVDGVLQTFIPVPTSFTPPTVDDSGTQEAQIIWCGIGDEAKAYIDKADPSTSHKISCRYTVYILGNPQPQNDPFTEFHISSATITLDSVAVTVDRADYYDKKFPTEVYKLSMYPGLIRG